MRVLSDWRCQTFCGATPEQPHAHFKLRGRCSVARSDWGRWWQSSLAVVHRLAPVHPLLRELSVQAHALPLPAHPLFGCLMALHAACGVTAYPLQVGAEDEGMPIVITNLPYRDAALQFLSLASGLLELAWTAMQGQRTSASALGWRQALDKIESSLPSRPLRAMHQDLWCSGVDWEWLGGERTRVGQGVGQCILSGTREVSTGRHYTELLREPAALGVPIYTVTGSVGKTTTVRLLGQLLQTSGRRLGLTASDGVWLGGRRLTEGDSIGGVSARALLRQSGLEIAVFEQGRGGMIKQGVPYAASDVAVLLNVLDVQVGLDGVASVEAMADVKALGLAPARLAVLNFDDPQCRRLGGLRAPGSCVWFSRQEPAHRLRELSLTAHGVAGVSRHREGQPLAIELWNGGTLQRSLGLAGVAPYHGMLGEKTLEELLAATAAAWFGPVPLSRWDDQLSALRLDASNHAFRTSVHRQEGVVFVLDKASEPGTLDGVRSIVDEICRREGITRRIGVLCRSAGEVLQRHLEGCRRLHGFLDEFICFDRPETYSSPAALPGYEPGSIPGLLGREFETLNRCAGVAKPVTLAADWEHVERLLRERLAGASGWTLVLVNQPTTSAPELNRRILEFAENGLTEAKT